MTGSRAIKALMLVGLTVGAPAYAQAQSGVGVVTTLVGEAAVERAAASKPVVLKKLDNVFAMDRIATKERSVVHVLMGGKALLTVRELSVVTITEEGGRSTVDLQSGKVGLAVVREKMKPGEVIEVHTLHAVAAVRGTVLVVEVVPGSAGKDQLQPGESSTNVYLLHGKLDVSLRSNPGAAPVQLESLQSVTVTRGALGTMRQGGKGRNGNAGQVSKAKAGEAESNGDSIIPVGDTADGARVANGNGLGSNDSDGNGRGSGNGNGGGNGFGGRGTGPASEFGGGRGPSLGSGGGVGGGGFGPIVRFQIFKKKN